MVKELSDQSLIFGEDGEIYRWFLLPNEASRYISGWNPIRKQFKMPFFPRKSVRETKISSRGPSKSVWNPHVCATCGSAGMPFGDERTNHIYSYKESGEHFNLFIFIILVCLYSSHNLRQK